MTTKRGNMGKRKKEKQADGREVNFHMRLLGEEDIAFKARAASKGMTVSAWLRQLGRQDSGLGG